MISKFLLPHCSVKVGQFVILFECPPNTQFNFEHSVCFYSLRSSLELSIVLHG